MARILLVEDDAALARGLSAGLKAAGYAVDVVGSGQMALTLAREEPFALITLDLGLPDMPGLNVLKALRREGNRTPILILTARDALEDRIAGLDHGADDYLLKPFEPTELEARIRALLRRAQGDASPVVTIGTLVLDQSQAMATVSGRMLSLTRREWAVLERLVARVGKVVSKDRLSSEIFGFDEPVGPNAIEVYVARLRKKLGADAPEIRTIRGLGYILVVP